jgi:hypothetical protein
VADPAATAVLCWASTHGFYSSFHSEPAPDDSRLVRAAMDLYRRAAGSPPRRCEPS